jgi:spermidine synthase
VNLKGLRVLGSLACAIAFSVQAENVNILHEERSLYRNILVYQEGQQRCLKFGRKEDARQTCRMQNDPDQLVFSYTKLMMASLYLNPSPKRVLIIGLGGGTLPGALRKAVPTAQIDVVEIDPAVTRVAYKYFGFTPHPLTQVHEQDGRVFVKRKLREKATYDLVMLDAFTDQYIPEHLLTQEFLQEVKRIMTPNGVLAANTFSHSGLYHHESATYASVFGRFFGLKTNSRVILTRLGSMPTQQELRTNAEGLEDTLRPMGTGADYLLPKIVIDSGWPKGTRVLTDQYSPANLLNLR